MKHQTALKHLIEPQGNQNDQLAARSGRDLVVSCLVLSNAAFQRLLADVRDLLAKAQSHRSVDNHLVFTYWNVGQRIVSTGVLDNSSLGDAVVKQLSDQLGIDIRTLQRSVAFFHTYGELPVSGLTWAHYRELVKLPDPTERAFYEALAVEEGLSRDRLLLAIDSDVFSKHAHPKRKVQLPRPSEPRYLFEATLLRVVDGDTLLFDIDVGFEITKQQRVRLSAVNTFSADSTKGKDATAFVVERLALADRIVLQTRRADLHGRYLAHVFYSTRQLGFLETFDRGHYLNQQLLDRKLAMKMR